MNLFRKIVRKAVSLPPSQWLLGIAVRVSDRDRATIRRYLASHAAPRLHIGAGENLLDGWLNTHFDSLPLRARDGIYLDATRRFPFPDDSFDHVFSEHMIEHVSYAGGQAMLRECFRVLKPGGRIRITTPDMAFLIGLLADEPGPLERAYIEWAAKVALPAGEPRNAVSVVNNFVRAWGHLYIYDRANLEQALVNAGFTEVSAWSLNESGEPLLRGLENPGRMPAGFLQLESMTLEAVKPR